MDREHRSAPILRSALRQWLNAEQIEHVIALIDGMDYVIDECGHRVGESVCIRPRGHEGVMHVNIFGQSKAGAYPVRNPTLF